MRTATFDPRPETFEVGAQIIYRPVLLPPPANFNGIADVTDWETSGGRIMTVNFVDRTTMRVEGTATMVAPGVALCATHVVEPWMDRLASHEAMALFIGFTADRPVIWRLGHLLNVPGTDLSIVGLILSQVIGSNEIQWDIAPMTTRLPVVGERLTMFGFRSPGTVSIENTNNVDLTAALKASAGSVTNVYPQGRDRFLLPWPVAEIDAEAHGGMSGGPVFDDRGYFIGMVCSSFSNTDGTSGGAPTYVSLGWVAMQHTFTGGWPIAFENKSLKMLAAMGHGCSIEECRRPGNCNGRWC